MSDFKLFIIKPCCGPFSYEGCPNGGYDNFAGAFATLEDAKNLANASENKNCHAQIVKDDKIILFGRMDKSSWIWTDPATPGIQGDCGSDSEEEYSSSELEEDLEEEEDVLDSP